MILNGKENKEAGAICFELGVPRKKNKEKFSKNGPVYKTLSGLEEVLQRQYQVASQCLEMAPHSFYYTMQYVYCVMHGLSMVYKKINPKSYLVGFPGQGPASGPPRRGPRPFGGRAGRGQYTRPSGCVGAGPRSLLKRQGRSVFTSR